MIVNLPTDNHLEFLSLKGGCRGSSESTHVKIPHCWISHALASTCFVDPPVVTLSWNVQEKRLTCSAAGVPATYTFSKWKQMVGFTTIREIQGVVAVDGTSYSLTLSGSKPYMDTGVYRCGASNDVLGKADSKIQTAEQAIEITGTVIIF